MSCERSRPRMDPVGRRSAISAVILPSPQPTSSTRSSPRSVSWARLRSANHFCSDETSSYSRACHSGSTFIGGSWRHGGVSALDFEVGSGHSSCVMVDTAELFLDGHVDFTFIEPYPGRLLSLLRPEDLGRVKILAQRVQALSIALSSCPIRPEQPRSGGKGPS